MTITNGPLDVMVNVPPFEDVPQQPVEEKAPPTFSQSLLSAMAAFTGDLSALSTARGGVTAAAENRESADSLALAAQEAEETAEDNEAEVSESAMETRDKVVDILRSWTP